MRPEMMGSEEKAKSGIAIPAISEVEISVRRMYGDTRFTNPRMPTEPLYPYDVFTVVPSKWTQRLSLVLAFVLFPAVCGGIAWLSFLVHTRTEETIPDYPVLGLVVLCLLVVILLIFSVRVIGLVCIRLRHGPSVFPPRVTPEARAEAEAAAETMWDEYMRFVKQADDAFREKQAKAAAKFPYDAIYARNREVATQWGQTWSLRLAVLSVVVVPALVILLVFATPEGHVRDFATTVFIMFMQCLTLLAMHSVMCAVFAVWTAARRKCKGLPVYAGDAAAATAIREPLV